MDCPGLENKAYVGLETALRGLAVFLPACRCDIAERVDVRKPLALADYLLRNGLVLPCSWSGCSIEAAGCTRQ